MESELSKKYNQISPRYGKCNGCNELTMISCEVTMDLDFKKSDIGMGNRMWELLKKEHKTICYLCEQCAILKLV
jgi:hypothetical protein